jgi:intracellular sulfur oxidation DsrE/DsrF family protein
MSLHANIEHLAAAQGIEAVAVFNPSGPREVRGDERWTAVLDAALNLLGKTEEPTIRLVVGKHTVVVQTEKDETVAVVLPTGHAIAKSLRRMIRRMSRKIRAPLPQSASTVSSSVIGTASGTQSGSSSTASTAHSDSADSMHSWG